MRSVEIINNRNQIIYNEYAELWGQGLREELIWPKLSEKFFIAEKTVYRIVLIEGKKRNLHNAN